MGVFSSSRMAASKRAAKKATPAKKTPAKKATPAKKSASKSKIAKRVGESSSGSAWENAAMKVSGSRKRKASSLVASDDFHSGSLPAQGTKPLKRNRASKPAAKKTAGKQAASVTSELKQIVKLAQAA